jgi:hypothetical protein
MASPPIVLKTPLELETRMKTPIINLLDRTPSIAGYFQAVIDFKSKFSNAIHRPVGPCKTFNCHGLTFASRRTWVGSPEVSKILADDDYVQVPNEDPILPGDIALYVKDRDYNHSGIVVYLKQDTPWILSKWGECQEAVHAVLDCPYFDCNVEYHRVNK